MQLSKRFNGKNNNVKFYSKIFPSLLPKFRETISCDLIYNREVYWVKSVRNLALFRSFSFELAFKQTGNSNIEIANDTFIKVIFRKIDDLSDLWIWVEFKARMTHALKLI